MTERYLYNKAKIFLRPYEYLELEQPIFPANIVAVIISQIFVL